MGDHDRYNELCCSERQQLGGGILEITPKCILKTHEDLSRVYTPGVAEPCLRIANDVTQAYTYTMKANTVAIISDGTAVLGLGDIGPHAALPVMEGKSLLFKTFGNVDAMPIVVDTKDVDELEKLVRLIAPTFGGINLEDISAPRCVDLIERLQDLDIPVFHDDQDGTAVVTIAALHNALKVTGKHFTELKVVLSGAGAAAYAIVKMLNSMDGSPREILVCDSKGIINRKRPLAFHKEWILKMPGVVEGEGSLADALKGADVFIGVSKAGLVTREMVATMNADPILFAMANPDPEITPEEAFAGGAALVGTGRSDYPNQVNNVLAFPGIFRGALDARARQITPEMKLAAAIALADYVKEPTKENILPDPLDKAVAMHVAKAVAQAWIKQADK